MIVLFRQGSPEYSECIVKAANNFHVTPAIATYYNISSRLIRFSTPAMANTHWNPILTERQRVLLHTQPLMLMRYHWMQRDDDGVVYDPLVLCMKLFEFLIDESGFGNDVLRETVATELTPLLSAVDIANDVKPDNQRHQRVLDRLIANLLNDSNRGESFLIDYTDFEPNGRIPTSSSKSFSFKLLKEIHGYTGQIALQLSPEAINLFLNALNLDIESEQIAIDAVTKYHVERGNFEKAKATAETARARSIQYEQNVHRIIEQVKRDIRQVNWREDVHKTIVDANEHIDLRLKVEQGIVRSAKEALDSLEDDDEKRTSLNQTIRLMDECATRHLRLGKRLMTVRGEFIDQQSRQSFVNLDIGEQINLRNDFLQPLLGMESKTAVELTESVGHSLLGARTPKLFSLRQLVEWQLQPKRESISGESPVHELELVETGAELTRLDDDVLSDCRKVFAEVDETTRLSDLLDRLELDGVPFTVQDAIALQVLERFDAEDEFSEADVGVEVADLDGLETARCVGDDLLIVPLS